MELKRQGGLIDESKQFYSPFKGVYKRQAMCWEFPSGAMVSFAAIGCDDDLGGWQGSQLGRALIDEAADQWTQKQVLFLQSRLRSTKSKIKPQLIMTCNPDPDSFLYDWIKDWALDEDGVPKKGVENIIRWFVTMDDKMYWGNDPYELYQEVGEPRGLIYAKDMGEKELQTLDPSLLFIPKSFRFVPATVKM